MLGSSIGLMVGRVVSMGLGFLTWLAAARLFEPAEVGIAAAAVAAMMLGVQLALVGTGAAVISLIPEFRDKPSRLINTAAGLVLLLSLAVAIGFLMLAYGVLIEMTRLVMNPVAAFAFILMVVFGSLNVLLDHVSVAVRAGQQVLTRNTLFGGIALGIIIGGPAVIPGAGFEVILAGWAAGSVAACAVGIVQTLRSVPGYRLSDRPEARLIPRLWLIGAPNWALTITERIPPLILPILVIELLSPETNAYWYAIWMMAWVVMIVPMSFGQSAFAEAAARPLETSRVIRQGIRASLSFGLLAALALATVADLALGLLGPRYAEAGTWPLRILVFALVPATILQAYFALCRARRRLTEAVIVGGLGGSLSVGATIAAGLAFGLFGMAAAWVTMQALVSTIALGRLHRLQESRM